MDLIELEIDWQLKCQDATLPREFKVLHLDPLDEFIIRMELLVDRHAPESRVAFAVVHSDDIRSWRMTLDLMHWQYVGRWQPATFAFPYYVFYRHID